MTHHLPLLRRDHINRLIDADSKRLSSRRRSSPCLLGGWSVSPLVPALWPAGTFSWRERDAGWTIGSRLAGRRRIGPVLAPPAMAPGLTAAPVTSFELEQTCRHETTVYAGCNTEFDCPLSDMWVSSPRRRTQSWLSERFA